MNYRGLRICAVCAKQLPPANDITCSMECAAQWRSLKADAITDKRCCGCSELKPVDSFYQVKGRYRSLCKLCFSEAVTARRNAVPIEVKRESYRTKTAKWRRENPVKAQILADAHNAVNSAIRSGSLTRRPCDICGSAASDAHHDDYSKPLDVRWLCHLHHMRHHRTVKSALEFASGLK